MNDTIKSEIIDGKEYREVTVRGRTKLISRDGSAINPTHRNQKATIHYNSDGYPCFGGGVPVHLYVARAWVDGYFEGAEVNHKDYDRSNYHADNLEWVTHIDNVRYSSDVGHYKNKIGESNPNYGNHVLHDFYSNNPDIAKEKLGRPGKQNGRARGISIKEKSISFETIGDCAEWLIKNGISSSTVNSIRQSIITSITNHKKYKNLTFNYI